MDRILFSTNFHRQQQIERLESASKRMQERQKLEDSSQKEVQEADYIIENVLAPCDEHINILITSTCNDSAVQQTEAIQVQNKIQRLNPPLQTQTSACRKSDVDFHSFLLNNSERKILLMIGLIDVYNQVVDRKREERKAQVKQLHQQRRHAYNLSTHSSFEAVDPVPQQQLDREYTHLWFQKAQPCLKKILQSNLNKRRELFEQKQHEICEVISNSGHINERHKSSMLNLLKSVSQNEQLMVAKNSSQPQLSAFDREIEMHKKKFQLMSKKKLNANHFRTKTCLLRPSVSMEKFQARKKEELKVFLNLNEKTENLEKFRKVEGMLFKFNQNLKITAESINLCRAMLLNKKSLINSDFKSPKSERVKEYVSQANSLFDKVFDYILRFIKHDRSYQNFQKQNHMKSKLKRVVPTSQFERMYSGFVDRCFDMVEVFRIYFSVLNQLLHQNIKIQHVLQRKELDRENKNLIHLRYVLIYLHKQAENTSLLTLKGNPRDSSVKRKPKSGQDIKSSSSSKLLGLQNCDGVEKQITQKELTLNRNMKEEYSAVKEPHEKQNQSFNFGRLARKSSTKKLTLQSLNKSSNRNSCCDLKANQTSRKSQEIEVDIQQLWKSFYDKKYASKLLKLRLF